MLLLAAGAQAFSQISVLDPSFKVGPGANDAADALVVQADQRILVGGVFTSIGGCSNSYLARLNSDGTVDTSFNPAGQTDGGVECLLQQPDRKVLVGGGFGRLLGHPQPALARLLEDGSLDSAFDASTVFTTNDSVFSLAVQDDGRVLAGCYSHDGQLSRVLRLNANGTPDATFVCTNLMGSFIFALSSLPDGSVLCGGNPIIFPDTRSVLFRLKPDGQLDDLFTAELELSSVFCLVRQTNGQILVGGLLNRTGASNSVPLLRLNADLRWDESFKIDALGGVGWGGFMEPSISALLLQPDGKLIVGGYFLEVAGYSRRQIVRLDPEGHVDGCFDPGLGLGGMEPAGPVRAMALQSDGRILLGGLFHGIDTAYSQANLARLLPRSTCDSIRVYLKGGDPTFAAATFPPGGTNYLEASADLTNWQTILIDTSPYLYDGGFSMATAPQAFFRARQER